MKLKVLITLVVLALVCVVIFIKTRSDSRGVDSQSEEDGIMEQNDKANQDQGYYRKRDDASNVASKEESNYLKKGKSLSSDYKKPFSSSPDPKEYKEKIDNSHVLDSELRPFAREMAASMSEAKKDKSKAKDVFEKFKTCAQSSSSQEIFAVRASCAENLKTLSKLYPDQFSKEYSKVEAGLPEDVKKALF